MNLVKQRKWDYTFLLMAQMVAERHSKDPSRKVGAIIARDTYPLSFGYNGLPRGWPDNKENLSNERERKLSLTIHAEVNAILNAVRNNINIMGSTLYCTHYPCNDCAKSIVQAGIERVVVFDDEEFANSSWKDSIRISSEIFRTMNINVILLDKE